ncbi:uncharacterized protein LOC132559444 isoform X2 [Ylistrum balloti]|uniref:uncharacterized protein LOC132559444 isoform X2 n=1 Tax=Ylistrum balloti TaxID=509963 RepID=UPI002905E339|nr:uncharacterized protein LOC132559444 isoform X2 [Ylistrum balloti]
MYIFRSLCRRQVNTTFRCGFEYVSTFPSRSNVHHNFINDVHASPQGQSTEKRGNEVCGSKITLLRQINVLYAGTFTELLRPRHAHTTFVQKRHKSVKGKKKDDLVAGQSESDDDSDGEWSDADDLDNDAFPDTSFRGDTNLPANCKMLKRNIAQPRYDSLCRFGFIMSSKQFVNELAEQKCKLNGLPLKSKSTHVKSGDALDVIVDDNKMKRIRIVSIDKSPSTCTVYMRVWRAPFSKSLVKESDRTDVDGSS